MMGRRNETVARVRYIGWANTDREPSHNESSDHVLTSHDMRSTRRTKAVAGPSGHQYRFRGRKKSQWLPITRARREDVKAFQEAEGFEVERQ